METIQMYDPKREYNAKKEAFDNVFTQVCSQGRFINGPQVEILESKLSDFTGCEHSICVSNGTDALKIALLALNIGYKDEVLTVSHSWISTAEVIPLVGATPVFVDIEQSTFNMDPVDLEAKIKKCNRPKAIIYVSLYGHIGKIYQIMTVAQKYNIPVIEDGAQSFGATCYGKRSCSITHIGTTSFFPTKPLGCYGDGGACFTNNNELGVKMRAIKNHGCVKRFHHDYIGMNARLDSIQAGILNVKMNYFEDTIRKRQECAEYYLDGLKGNKNLVLPKILPNNTSVWAQFSLLAPNREIRDNIVQYLKDNNVNVAIFYPVPLHTQKCFEYLNYNESDLPVTNDTCSRIFNLPCYGELTRLEQNYIILLINNFFNKDK